MPKLTDYKNFWLIWLSSAGSPRGMSLFRMQTEWGIKTNFLYHIETGIGKPLYLAMIREGYLEKDGKYLKAKYEWIPRFIKEQQGEGNQAVWTPDVLINSKWPLVQDFIEKHSSVIFEMGNIKLLYRNNRDVLGESGKHVFMDIFLYTLFANLINFTEKYHADIVLRIISTMISVFSDRDLLNYMRHIHEAIGKDVPVVLTDENELNRMMYPLGW